MSVEKPYQRPDSPYLPQRLCATFEGWKVDGVRADGSVFTPIMTEIPGKFEVEIRQAEYGRRTVYWPLMAGTLQKIGTKPFARCKLDECKSFVECQFRKKLKDWEEVG